MGLLVVLDISKRMRDRTKNPHTNHADKTDNVTVNDDLSSPVGQESVSTGSNMNGPTSNSDPDSPNDTPQEDHHD